jgi:hypothetical protein
MPVCHACKYVCGGCSGCRCGCGRAEDRLGNRLGEHGGARGAEPRPERGARTRGDATHPPAATVLRGDRAITKGPDTETVP